MSPINGLKVYLWVPIWVKNDYDVGLVEVDAQAASTRWQDKKLLVRFWALKIFNSVFSVVRRGLTINPTIVIATVPQKIIQNIK